MNTADPLPDERPAAEPDRVDHRSVYETLLSAGNERALARLLEEQGVLSLLRARSVEVRRDRPLPYVLLMIDADRGVFAQCTCVFVDVGGVVPQHAAVPYFLPMVALAEQGAGEETGRAAAALEHELLHLSDTLALIERDPDYPRRVFAYGIHNTTDPALLAESVDVEVFKLFALEPQAFALDYANGETALEIPFLGRVVRVACDSLEEFVHHRVAEYVKSLEREICEIHPGERPRVHAEIERAVERHGLSLFGPSAYRRVSEIHASTLPKMLDPERRARAKATAGHPPRAT